MERLDDVQLIAFENKNHSVFNYNNQDFPKSAWSVKSDVY